MNSKTKFKKKKRNTNNKQYNWNEIIDHYFKSKSNPKIAENKKTNKRKIYTSIDSYIHMHQNENESDPNKRQSDN